MSTEWGRLNYLTTSDVKIRFKWHGSDGKTHTIDTMPDFTFKFYIENRKTTALTASKSGSELTNCYINEEDGYLYVNIPKNTFAAGNLCFASEPVFGDLTFDDETFEPSLGFVTKIKYI